MKLNFALAILALFKHPNGVLADGNLAGEEGGGGREGAVNRIAVSHYSTFYSLDSMKMEPMIKRGE